MCSVLHVFIYRGDGVNGFLDGLDAAHERKRRNKNKPK